MSLVLLFFGDFVPFVVALELIASDVSCEPSDKLIPTSFSYVLILLPGVLADAGTCDIESSSFLMAFLLILKFIARS